MKEPQPIISEQTRSKIYLTVFAFTAGLLAWGAWTNYRPKIILSSCADIATTTFDVYKRSSIDDKSSYDYNDALEECLLDAGYYN